MDEKPQGDPRADLIPPCCSDCPVDVVDATSDGTVAFWAQHGTTSHACATGAEVLGWLAEQHLVDLAADQEELLAAEGVPV